MTAKEFSENANKAAREAGGKAAHEYFQKHYADMKFSSAGTWDHLSPEDREHWSSMEDAYTDAFMSAYGVYARNHISTASAEDIVQGPEPEFKGLFVLDESGQAIRA